MANKIQSYRDQFLMINECKDSGTRDRQLAALMTEIENEFNIPMIKDEKLNKANPVVIALYQDISNARML